MQFIKLYDDKFQRCQFIEMRIDLDTNNLMSFSPDQIIMENEQSYDVGSIQFVLLRLNKGKNCHDDSIFCSKMPNMI